MIKQSLTLLMNASLFMAVPQGLLAAESVEHQTIHFIECIAVVDVDRQLKDNSPLPMPRNIVDKIISDISQLDGAATKADLNIRYISAADAAHKVKNSDSFTNRVSSCWDIIRSFETRYRGNPSNSSD